MNIKKLFPLLFCMALVVFAGCNQNELMTDSKDYGDMVALRSSSPNGAPVPVNLTYTPGIVLNVYNGEESETPYWKATDYIPINNASITQLYDVFGVEDNGGGQVVFWYDVNKNFIKGDCSKFQSEFSTPTEARYIRVNQHISYTDVPLYKLRTERPGKKENIVLQYEEGIYLYFYTGAPQSSPYWKCSQPIPVTPDDVFAVEDNAGGQTILWFTSGGEFIYAEDSKVAKELTTPPNAGYLYVNQHVSYPADVPLYKVHPENLISGYLFCHSIDDAGQVDESSENCYWKYTDFISISPNILYHTSKKYAGQTIFWYNSSKQLIHKGVEFYLYQDVIKPPSNAAYIRVLQHTECPDVPFYECNN